VRHAEDVLDLVISRDRALLPFGLRTTVRATPISEHILSPEIANSVHGLTFLSDGEVKREVFWIFWVVLQEYKVQAINTSEVIRVE